MFLVASGGEAFCVRRFRGDVWCGQSAFFQALEVNGMLAIGVRDENMRECASGRSVDCDDEAQARITNQ